MSRRRQRELEELFDTAEGQAKKIMFYTVMQIVSVGLMVFGVIYFILRVTEII